MEDTATLTRRMGALRHNQRAVPCWFMRGGSTRGGVFLASDLPADPRERAALLLAIYGSPDPRQLDGIGGGDPATSKAAVVGPSARPDADVDYTFLQIGIDRPEVSSKGNCGNMASAAAAFAVLAGLVPADAPETLVRVFTTNTGQIVTVTVPVADGAPAVDGDCAIPGVPVLGARMMLDFGDCAGAVTGRLLPTGSVIDRVPLDGREIEVSLVDATTAFVFVAAADVGATGRETPDEILADTALRDRIEAVRGWAATVMGLSPTPDEARALTPNTPRIMMVAPPDEYRDLAGRTVTADAHDLMVRQIATPRPHRALAVVGAVCCSVATAIEGTVAHRAANRAATPAGGALRLGHPSGVLRVDSRVSRDGSGAWTVQSARIERTARLLSEGVAYASETRIAALRAIVEI